MDKSFKKGVTFMVTEEENKLMEKILETGASRVMILRRGIVSMCEELNISLSNS